MNAKKFASQWKHVDSVANTHKWANCLRAELSAVCVQSESEKAKALRTEQQFHIKLAMPLSVRN